MYATWLLNSHKVFRWQKLDITGIQHIMCMRVALYIAGRQRERKKLQPTNWTLLRTTRSTDVGFYVRPTQFLMQQLHKLNLGCKFASSCSALKDVMLVRPQLDTFIISFALAGELTVLSSNLWSYVGAERNIKCITHINTNVFTSTFAFDKLRLFFC